MEMGDLNSLAEVGVALNLAFGLIKGVRGRFSSLFSASINVKTDAIRTKIAESPIGNGINPSGIAVRVEDISQNFEKRTSLLENCMVVFSFLIAVSLTYFLLRSAITPRLLLPLYAGWVLFCLVWFSIVSTLIIQWVLYQYANYCLTKREKEYDTSLELISPVIPSPPK